MFNLILLLVNLFTALSLRLKYWFTERMWQDEALYAWIGQRIYYDPILIFSKEAAAFHPPFFSFLLSFGHFFLPSALACRLVTLIFNMLGIVAIYLLGKKISSPFVGMMASIFLAHSYIYVAQSNLILIDGVLTVFYIVFMHLLLNVTDKSRVKEDMMIGIFGMLMVLLKWSGLLILPIMIMYYLLALDQLTIKKRLKKLFIPLLCVLCLVLLFFINAIFPVTKALRGDQSIEPWWYYFVHSGTLIHIPFILPFFIIGIKGLNTIRRNSRILIYSWYFVLLIILCLIPEKTPRYILPLIPCIFLISSIGIEYLLVLIFKSWLLKVAKVLAGILCLMSCLLFQPDTLESLNKVNSYYLGFPKAGQWIKEQSHSNALVIAGSKRAIRYFSGINYQEFGGRLTSFPESKEEFERLIRESKTEIILETDLWEYTQPQWIYPLTREKIIYLEDLGFHLEKIIFKSFISLNEIKPVIWIYKMIATKTF